MDRVIREIVVKEHYDENGLFIRQDVIAELVRCEDCKFNRESTPCQIRIRGVDWCSRGKRYVKKEE